MFSQFSRSSSRITALISLFFSLILLTACSTASDIWSYQPGNPANTPYSTPPKTTEQILAEFPNPPLPTKTLIVEAKPKNITYTVEIADKEETRRKGLMVRTVLTERKGMLFIFDKEEPLSFWMKNVKFPLDMIFLDKNMKIVDIIPYASPCPLEPCLNYVPKVPAQYVLEINAGQSDILEIKIGDQIRLE